MIKEGVWSDSCDQHFQHDVPLFLHLFNPAPVLPPVTILASNSISSLSAEVLAMRYRALIQKMNKFHQLDLARVNVFRDIEAMVRGFLVGEDDTQTVTSSKTRNTSVDVGTTPSSASTIKAHGMARLLDNLWYSAELVDCSAVRGAPKKGSARLRTSGIETLRTEYDSLKEHASHTAKFTTSECSFLKWASAAIPVTSSERETHPALPPSPKDLSADLLKPTKPLPVPVPVSENANHSSVKVNSIRNRTSTTNRTLDEVLDRAVFDAIPMMGSMEECILELMDSASLDYRDICDISSSIDSTFSTMGLTVEEIDRYCQGLDVAYEYGSEQAEDSELNNITKSYISSVFEIMDSQYNDPSTSTLQQAHSNVLFRHLQQQFGASVDSNEIEVANLRQLHGNTMMRTANVCAKFCPYEISWSKEALQKYS